MSSLAAARADNFYYPTDFDPKKHRTLAGYTGQHPLRERAAKLDQGILVIRFEVPYNIWCEKCGDHIGKGVRFNAEKKQVGMYHSTKVWGFTMRHHCGCMIEIHTDPKNCDYLVVAGARRKVQQSYKADDVGVIELDDTTHKNRMEDPLYRLEHKTVGASKAEAARKEVQALQRHSDVVHKDDYARNKALRAAHRKVRREAKSLEAEGRAYGLPEHVQLARATPADELIARTAPFTSAASAAKRRSVARREILSQPIFGGGSRSGGSRSAAGPSSAASGGGKRKLGGGGLGAVVAGRVGKAASSLKRKLAKLAPGVVLKSAPGGRKKN